MNKEEYQDFVLRYKGCGACFPMYHTLSRFEKMWFTAIQKDVAKLVKENAELKERLKEHESVGNEQFWKNVWSWKIKATQLTKAKELLAKWVELYKPKLEDYPITPIQEQTEQFISEVEK